MTSAYVIVTTSIQSRSQSTKLFAGKLITDATTLALAQAAGVPLGSGTDQSLAAASAVVVKMRKRGADESVCNNVMMAAFAQSAEAVGSERATYQATAIAATATAAAMTGSPAARGGTIQDILIVMGQTAFGAGESSVVNPKQNGTALLSAAVTLSATTPTAGVLDELANLVGTGAVLIGDQFTCDNTYTAGTPNHPNYSVVIVWA